MSKKILVSFFIMFGVSAYAADTVTSDSTNSSYWVVVDAGSTGNRVYVDEVVRDKATGTFKEVRIKNIKDKDGKKLSIEETKNKAPIADHTADEAITPLLNLAKTYLSSDEKVKEGVVLSNVPVSVLATAGMRILEDEDEQKGTNLVETKFTEVQKAIEHVGFKKSKKVGAGEIGIGEVGTIPGYDEGLYSWLDVNYGNLETAAETNGIIEIGGASAQIAFNTSSSQVPSDFAKTTPPIGKITNFTLNGKKYNVFSISYLGLGQNMARKLMNEFVDNSKTTDDLNTNMTRDRCYSKGYTNTAEPLLFPDFLFSDSKVYSSPDHNFTIGESKYDFATCGKNYQNTLSMTKFASLPVIKMVDGFSDTVFMGLASIYWRLDPLEMAYLPEQNADKLKSNLEIKCALPNGAFIKDPKLTVDCANTTYVYEFLYGKKGLGIKDSNLTTQTRDATNTATWTRGYVLYQSLKNQATN